MPVPWNVDENFEILRGGEVEKPFRWNLINADDIRAEFADLGEVSGSLLGRGKQLAGSIGSEWPVSNALGVKFLFAEPEKFAIHGDACGSRSRLCH